MTSIRVFQHYTHHLYAAAALFEASLAFAAMMGALQLSAAGHLPGPAAGTPLMMIWQAGVVALAFVVASDAMGQYSPLRAEEGFASHAKHGAGAFVLPLFGLLLLGLLLPSLRMNPLLPGGALLLTTGLIVGLRTPFFLGMAQRGALRQKVMIVGAGRNAQHALEVLRQRPERVDFDVVGCVPLPGEAVRISGEKLLPGNLPLTTLAKRLNVAQMIVVPDHETEFPLNDLIGCRFDGRQVVSGVQFFEREARILDVDLLPPDALAFGDGFYQPPLSRALKRAFDIAASGAVLALAWPLMLVAVVAIKLEEGLRAPVLYKQTRVGQNGKPFSVLKFRSMRVDAEADGKARWASVNDSRVTRVGAFIRRTRIDELPQIFNVLSGEMSFIGPRPERPEFVQQLAEQIPYYNSRHAVKPGITGWAQLCYPYGASEEDARQKLQFDLYYVKNQSLFLDLMVALSTVEVVIFGKGAR